MVIWNKSKLQKGVQKIPMKHFDDNHICPICNKKIKNLEDEKFLVTKSVGYIRMFNKYYWVHKECFYVTYEGMADTVQSNIEEYTAYAI